MTTNASYTFHLIYDRQHFKMDAQPNPIKTESSFCKLTPIEIVA